MKYRDPETGLLKDIFLPAGGDTLPIGTIVNYDGEDVPMNYELVDGGEILNEASTSMNDSYSCNYVNNLNTYSTTEQKIGTWIDGRPIYQITIVLDSLVDCVANTWTTVASISNLNIRACINSNLISNNDWCWSGYLLRNNSGNLQVFNVGTTWAVFKIILEYTKTTD